MGIENTQTNEQYGLKISFDCPNSECGYRVEDHIEDAEYDWSASEIGQVTSWVQCQNCEDEYTIEVVDKGVEKEVHLDGYPDVMVQFEQKSYDYGPGDEYEDFLAHYEPESPFEVYQQSAQELADLDSGSTIDVKGKTAFAKMLFLQHVVILEAYLSDRLLSVVANDEDKLVALVGATGALRDQTPKLIEIAKDPDFVKKATKAYLQRFSFHNLPGVSPFYKAVLGIDLFEGDEHRKEMMAIIETRHHIVHRNGRDASGKMVLLNDLAVQHVKTLVSRTVERVERAYSRYQAECFLRDNSDDMPF